MKRTSRWRPVLGATALAIGALSACSDRPGEEEIRYAEDYGGHAPLAVVGYPSVGSLRMAQEIVWRTADGDTEALASFAAPGVVNSAPAKTAENWIAAFGKGARGQVTAEFYDEASKRQMVVLYFHDTGQIKELSLRSGMGGEDRDWYVYMDQPDMADATAVRPSIPKTPGARGSKSTS
ncbi:hypothetical protein ACIQUV_32375 [Streptomyces globosus]|uniref:hypothetical protein n=1 Tax=Streptomyces globosus TaxID=68209 RepID=UPI00380C3A4E